MKKTLLVEQAAGSWSDTLFLIYSLNPLAGIIDSFQRVMFKGLPPDLSILWPGLVATAIALPLGYRYFKSAENYFVDVI